MVRYTFEYLGRHGRLGNQLWQIASTIGQARRYGATWSFPPWRYAPYFNMPPGWFDFNEPHYDDVDPGRVHMQKLVFINDIADDLRAWFKPSPLMEMQLKERYPWFWEIENPVALHVRRGDAVDRQMWHPLQPQSYHWRAMGIVAEFVENPTFIVFSDGIDWCKENMPDDCIFVSPEHIAHGQTVENSVDHEELFLMRACKEHIIANSTFSWWAAWLANNPRAIYPSVWFGVNYPELQATFRNDFIVPTWVEVPS